jgi:putative SOS response-associated peptidase YedK
VCGRYELNQTPAQLGSRYRIEPGTLEFAASTDVRPTETNPVVLLRGSERRLELLRWGFVPSWVRDPSTVRHPFNAISETAAEKPFFRVAYRRRRCIVPATAFFEWTPVPGMRRKRKLRIARADGEMLSIGGLHEYWRSGDDVIASYTILTTAANEAIAAVHDRMPVIVGDDELDAWLDPDTSVDTAQAMCMPCPSAWLTIGDAPEAVAAQGRLT